MSQVQTIVVKKGLAANVPTLLAGELGYDTDTKTLRVGDDSTTPAQVLSDKSTGTFDLSNATIKLGDVEIDDTKTFAGINLSTLNADVGFVVRSATSGSFTHTKFISSDSSITITNETGLGGDVDIKLHPDVISVLTSTSYLQSVNHDTTLTGTGVSGNPLKVTAATETIAGGLRIANQSEADNAVLANGAITPKTLANLDPAGLTATSLQTLMAGTISVVSDSSLTGIGTTSSPLSLEAAAEAQSGGIRIATQAITDLGLDDTTALTPFKLANLTSGSTLAQAIASTATGGATWNYTSLPTDGSVQTLAAGIQELRINVHAEVESLAGENYDAFVEFQTSCVVEMFVAGNWEQVGPEAISYASYGPISTVFDRPSSDVDKVVSFSVAVDTNLLSPRVIHSNGQHSGTWSNQIRAVTTLSGAGTIGGVTSANTGYTVAHIMYR